MSPGTTTLRLIVVMICVLAADSARAAGRTPKSRNYVLTNRMVKGTPLVCRLQEKGQSKVLTPGVFSVRGTAIKWKSLKSSANTPLLQSSCSKSRVLFAQAKEIADYASCVRADLTSDGLVDFADFNGFLAGKKKKTGESDLNADGKITVQDLKILLACLGSRSSGSSSSSASSGSNQSPAAIAQTVAASLDRPITIKLSGSDPENDSLSFTVVATPSHGTLSGAAPDLTYTPDLGFQGQDRLEFSVADAFHAAGAAAAVTITVGSYEAPLGVPTPSFGLMEDMPAYDSSNTHHYYVSGPTNCDNANNSGRGSPETPRCTIPSTLAAGDYVEVHGGPYTYGQGPKSWQGTAAEPVLIKGVGMPRFDTDFPVYTDAPGGWGAYVIIEGIDVYNFSVAQGYHHVALRYSNVQGDIDGGGVGISNYGAGTVPILNNVVIYHSAIHDSGVWDPQQATGDRDFHGVGIGWNGRVEQVWIIDNEIYHQEGDGVQIEQGNPANSAYVNHIYVGRNTIHHNKQTGLWVKNARDIIFSQNTLYGFRPSSSSGGACAGMQYNSQYIWYIFNYLSDCDSGFGVGSDDGSAFEHFFVGNVISNIHSATFDNNDPWSNGHALVSWGVGTKHFVNNTIFDTDGGLSCPSHGATCPAVIENTIFSQVTGAHVFLENSSTAAASTLTHSLFDGPARIRWGNSTDKDISQMQALGQCLGCSEASAALDGDLKPQAGSPARDSGMASSAYEAFFLRYGLSIAADRNGNARPLGSGWDIGAYEYQPG